MKLHAFISKTFQEDPYEPIRIELGLDKEVKDNLKEEEIQRQYGDLCMVLQDSIDEIYLERQKFRKED